MADVAFDEVDKVYENGVQAVFDLTLGINDGEFLVLVGPSGCGKTTALRMVAGLEDISAGTLSIGGRVVNDVTPKERDIAMVFQNYALYPHMTVRDNMSFALKLAKRGSADIRDRVTRAADILGLAPYLDRYPRQLSGGQRQRVAMGRAIVRQPKAFLFDEPLSNLDARLREQMRAEIKKLHGDLKATSIYVTHDQIEAMTLADRIVAMHGGVVQQVGSPLELYDHPANLFVAGFIGSPGMNFLDASYVDGGVKLQDGTIVPLAKPLPLEDGAKVTLGIRPEHVLMTNDGAGLATDVELVEPTGFGIILHLALHGLPFKIFTLDREALKAGPKVNVAFPAQYLHVFDDEGLRVD